MARIYRDTERGDAIIRLWRNERGFEWIRSDVQQLLSDLLQKNRKHNFFQGN
jgi:DNA-binding PadR family transcriptional regulator